MAAGTLISLDEYLHTSYRPDCEYVDGLLIERNAGKRDHSILQALLVWALINAGREFGFWAYPEQRIKVAGERVRIPDVSVVLGKLAAEQVFTSPPFLCIEILSPDDR